MFTASLEECLQVLVVCLLVLAIDDNIISNANDSLEVLQRPNRRRSHLNLPKGVWNAVNRLDDSSKYTCQYPDDRSALEKTLAPVSSCNTSSSMGMVYLSLCSTLLSSCGSMQTCCVPSFFGVITNWLSQGVGLDTLSIIPILSKQCSSCFNLGLSLTLICLLPITMGTASGFTCND